MKFFEQPSVNSFNSEKISWAQIIEIIITIISLLTGGASVSKACDITAKKFHISPKTVRKIWDNHKK